MTKEELLKKLETCFLLSGGDGQGCADTEMAHLEADCFLLEFINDGEITDAFNKIKKEYA